MIIALTGFMGCGKSSVGRRLSELLCCRFMDLDEVIESREGRTIPEIFAVEGEAGFRAMELEALGMIMDEYSSDLVLALGGGTVMTSECAELIHEHTYCIYLRASVDTLVSNLEGEAAGRPMLQSPAGNSQAETANDKAANHGVTNDGAALTDTDALRTRISDLMALRSSTYESVAHSIIDTDGKTISEIADIIVAKPTPEAGQKNTI